MRICDFIPHHLHTVYDVRNVYGLMGGGASGLNDGFIKYSDINYICFHHEQAAGYAAYGAARSTNKLAVVNPTTGCGGTNCMTPLLNAWQDSVPVLYISGNVRKSHTSNYINKTKNVSLRKYGVQEHDIINSVKSITKYAKVVEDPAMIKYEIDKAIDIATSGRSGPVWLDIPSDIQTAQLPDLIPYDIPISQHSYNINAGLAAAAIGRDLKMHNRPIILAGNGINLTNTQSEFKQFIESNYVPFVSTYLARDIISYDHPLNIGTIGIKGTRAANFALHHCDYLLVLGCSMNPTHLGYDEKQFSPYSKKVMIDIDPNEYLKGGVKIDKFYNLDLYDFFGVQNEQ